MESILALAFGCTFALGNSAVRADNRQPTTKVDCDAARHDVSRDAGGLIDDDHSLPALWWTVLIGKRFIKHGGWDGDSLRTAGAIGWAICGCERAPGAWAMQPQWARELRNQCTAAGVPFLLKR